MRLGQHFVWGFQLPSFPKRLERKHSSIFLYCFLFFLILLFLFSKEILMIYQFKVSFHQWYFILVRVLGYIRPLLNTSAAGILGDNELYISSLGANICLTPFFPTTNPFSPQSFSSCHLMSYNKQNAILVKNLVLSKLY